MALKKLKELIQQVLEQDLDMNYYGHVWTHIDQVIDIYVNSLISTKKILMNRRIIKRNEILLLSDVEGILKQRLWDQLNHLWGEAHELKWSELEVQMRVEEDD